MEKYTPLQEKAYQYLKEEILKGRFQYGKFYSETKIAAETGLSRTPIKDALTRLCHAKYVDIVPSKGFCLHKITKDDIKNSYELRSAIEGYCVSSLSSELNTPKAQETIKKLEEIINRMEKEADDKENLKDFLLSDMELHKVILSYSGNEEFLDLADSYNLRQYEYARETFKIPGRTHTAHNEHLKLLNAIKSGSSADAFTALKDHMLTTCNLVLKSLIEDTEK